MVGPSAADMWLLPEMEGTFAIWLCKVMPSLLPADRLSYVVMMEVLRITVGTLLLTALLELLCWRYVVRLWKERRSLYLQGIALNLFNHCIIAPLVFGPVLRWYVPM